MDLSLPAVMGSLRGKLKEKFKRRRRKGLSSKDIKFLKMELRSMHAALRTLGDVPPGELPMLEKSWANELRELSYDTEDVLDAYLVRVEGIQPADRHSSIGLVKKMVGPSKEDKTRHRIADAIRDIKSAVLELSEIRRRYGVGVDDIVAPARPIRVDPRSLYRSEVELVGIEAARNELIRRLTEGDDVSNQQLKIISLVGPAGLGKTTLAQALYHKLKSQFDCGVFVSLSPYPNMRLVFRDMLYQLGIEDKEDIYEASGLRNQTELIDKLKKILQNKRYLIVVDDIWEKKSWLTIKSALVDGNLGSRIITTTRKFDVAEEVGGAYEVQPLTNEYSEFLFRRKIFGTDDPNNELGEIAENILEKCGGVPLAIVTISSFLAGKPIEQWHEMRRNIMEAGFNSLEVGEIISLSYYNLPTHLRNCLLYLSVFPEGYVIRRDRLVWMWIAEGFVQEKQGSNLFEVGQSYLDELLNSSMIQEVDINGNDGMVTYCRVPILVLALILSVTSEENFATILDDRQQQIFPRRKVRRLSLQNGTVEHTTAQATSTCAPQVRSVIAFGTGINLMPLLSSFQVLRVMDLEGCDLKGRSDLKHLGELLHLRYLGLRGTLVAELPKEVGSLRFLQVLDLKGTEIEVLPSTVALLRRLLCLYVEHTTRLPKGLGNLTSLEELSKISMIESPNSLKELASLVELRVLDIVLQQDVDESSQKDLLELLCNLHKVQTLRISGCPDLDFMAREGWTPPPGLRRFIAVEGWFSALPMWAIKVEDLSELHLGVRELWLEDLQSLGRLRELRVLQLAVERMGERLAVDADAFPSLTQLRLRGETCLVFRRGAMPNVAVLELDLDVDKANGGFAWGFGNLPSLKQVTADLRCSTNASAAAEAEAALKHATGVHPNRPTLRITVVSSQQDDEQQIQSVDGPEKISNVASSSEISL